MDDRLAAGAPKRKYAPHGGGGRIPKNHVFIRGMLRCGVCGEAMPRVGEGRDTTSVARARRGAPAPCRSSSGKRSTVPPSAC